jgi:hypothetical protein
MRLWLVRRDHRAQEMTTETAESTIQAEQQPLAHSGLIIQASTDISGPLASLLAVDDSEGVPKVRKTKKAAAKVGEGRAGGRDTAGSRGATDKSAARGRPSTSPQEDEV